MKFTFYVGVVGIMYPLFLSKGLVSVANTIYKMENSVHKPEFKPVPLIYSLATSIAKVIHR